MFYSRLLNFRFHVEARGWFFPLSPPLPACLYAFTEPPLFPSLPFPSVWPKAIGVQTDRLLSSSILHPALPSFRLCGPRTWTKKKKNELPTFNLQPQEQR